MEFNYIVNPETGRKVSIFGKTGQRVLNNYMHSGGAIRSSSRIPSDQYQVGGAMRSGSRIPAGQYQVGGANCKKFRKTKDPKCDEQPGCHWVTNKGCLDDEEGHWDDSLTAAQRREGQKAVSDINKMWKSIKKISIELYGTEVYYMEDPEHWRVPPSALLESNNVFDLNSLKKQRDLTEEDLNNAQSDLKAYKASLKKTAKTTKSSGCKQYRKTKDPKCNDQRGCHWETGKGCLESTDAPVVAARAPMRPSAQVKPTGKKVKKVTTKAHGTTMRLSAGEYYRSHGNDKSLGDRCDIRKNDEYRCLLKRSNGTAYWAKKSKSGAGQEACQDWSSKCKEPDFA